VSAPERDPHDVVRVVRAWFEGVRGCTGVEVTNVAVPRATGFSNETILFDVAWSEGGDRDARQLVARVAPSSYQVFPDDTFELQFRVMRALAATGVPTAEVHWFEPDDRWFGRPFWIMERVHGDIPTDDPPYAGAGWLAAATPAQQARAWASGIEAMAAVHAVPLDGFAARASLDGAGDELERYERFLRWAEGDQPHALARETIAWLHRNRRRCRLRVRRSSGVTHA
jgi:aminoglycoside phosphotransferase (APT) family kinase protein